MDRVESRYGDRQISWIVGDSVRRLDGRARSQWRTVQQLFVGELHEPEVDYIHSPRALPAFVGETSPGSRRARVIWDAGIGTVFDTFALSLPYRQPFDVEEAFARRIFAIRCVAFGQPRQAAEQVAFSRKLFEHTPIDRSYQENGDAESQFESYLLTELQERFALAHEFGHAIEHLLPEEFDDFGKLCVAMAIRCTQEELPRGRLYEMNSQDLLADGHSALREIDIDPYAWYLKGDDARWSETVADSAAEAARIVYEATDSERSEIICDVLGAVAVALFAHSYKKGWSATQSVAASTFALATLQAIHDMDSWIAEGGEPSGEPVSQSSRRQRCLRGLLPAVLPAILGTRSSRPLSIPMEDLYSVIRLAECRYDATVVPALKRVNWLPEGIASESATNDQGILVEAGFIYLR